MSPHIHAVLLFLFCRFYDSQQFQAEELAVAANIALSSWNIPSLRSVPVITLATLLLRPATHVNLHLCPFSGPYFWGSYKGLLCCPRHPWFNLSKHYTTVAMGPGLTFSQLSRSLVGLKHELNKLPGVFRDSRCIWFIPGSMWTPLACILFGVLIIPELKCFKGDSLKVTNRFCSSSTRHELQSKSCLRCSAEWPVSDTVWVRFSASCTCIFAPMESSGLECSALLFRSFSVGFRFFVCLLLRLVPSGQQSSLFEGEGGYRRSRGSRQGK